MKRILKSSPSQTSSSVQLAPQTIGFSRIHTSYLRRLRKDRLDRIAVHTAQILFRLDQLTRKDVDIPPIGDTKERRSKFYCDTIDVKMSSFSSND